MWYPTQAVNEDIVNFFLAVLDNAKVKAELDRRIRIEIDNEKQKYKGGLQSYSTLTAGDVNMQVRMAQSGFDIYGRTIISSNNASSNMSTYRKMKNKIRYGNGTKSGFINRGQRDIV